MFVTLDLPIFKLSTQDLIVENATNHDSLLCTVILVHEKLIIFQAILLADVLPSLAIKLVAPTFIHKIHYK